MSLFGNQKTKNCWKYQERLERRLDAADGDRRRIKDNADKQGGMIVDLECKMKSLKEGKSNARKHKH